MKPDYKELKIQKDVISLLKNLSYKYLSPEETENLRGNNLRESLLKPILREQLMKINSYEYKGKEKKCGRQWQIIKNKMSKKTNR